MGTGKAGQEWQGGRKRSFYSLPRAKKPLSRGYFGLDTLKPHRWQAGEAFKDVANNECVANFKLTIIFQPSSQSPGSEANATNDCARFVFKTT